MNQLTIMILVPDRARADMVLKDDRIYYHFATESTEDEGELPGLKDRFAVMAERILEALKSRSGERPLPADEVKVTVFVDNMVRPTKDMTEEALKRLVIELTLIDDSFAFLQGFV